MRKWLIIVGIIVLALSGTAQAEVVKLTPSWVRYTLATSDSTISMLSTGPLVSMNPVIPEDQKSSVEAAFSEAEAYQYSGGYYYVMAQRTVIREDFKNYLDLVDLDGAAEASIEGMRGKGAVLQEVTTRSATVSGRPARFVRITALQDGQSVVLREIIFLDSRTLWIVIAGALSEGPTGREAIEKIIDSVRLEN